VTERLLSLVLGSAAVGRSVLGDLAEEYADRARLDRTAATWWYRREALGIALRSGSIARRSGRSATGARRRAATPAGDPLMRLFIHDLREAGRTLRKQRRLLVVASLTLALGIGAVTSIFSVVNGVLFRPLPYPHADRLVNVWSTAPGLGYDQFPLSPDLFLFYRRHNAVFEDMALFQRRRANLTESGPPEVVDSAVTTYSYFATVGAALSRGRPYRADEDRPEASSVVVMSHRLWTRRYGADPTLVGRTVRIDGGLTEVIGVAPAWLDETGSPDLWLPARFNPTSPPSGNFGWYAMARLKPHVGIDEASTHLAPLVKRAMEEFIQSETYRAFLTEGRYRPLVRSVKEDIIGSVREPLWILLGTVGLVLLVACANVANLCLIHAEARQREIAVRAALGGSRRSLVRKLLAEALVLSAIGSSVGVLLAAVALPVLVRLAPATIPRLDQVRLDGTVLLFAIGAAIVSALLFGVGPAIRYTRPDILAVLRHGGRSATDHPSRQRGRRLLVVAQTATALVLLVGASLLARSFSRLMGAELGFTPRDVLTFRVALPATTYPKSADVARFGQQLVDRLSDLPGIEAAGAATALPIAAAPDGTAFEFSGHPLEPGRLPPIVWHQTVTPGFFKTMGIPLLRGRDFDSTERRDGVHSVIVTKTLADRYWPGQDPIGKQLRTSSGESSDEPRPWFTVVGLVGPVRQIDLREPLKPQIYVALSPTDDNAPRAMSYAVRGPHVASQADAVRRAVWALDRDLPVAAVQTMDEIVERSVVQFSFTMFTLSLAAVIGLVLGAVGLYGVLSYTVSLRTREIGVRLALGAAPSRVMRSVVANGAAITGLGLVAGSLGAAALTRFLGALLYETEPLDVATFTLMPLILLAVALVASYLPARKAARVSPLEAMRGD
jgi:putative ABC transport system permease protein